jgi:2-iminobutanoate/2-iminopropanoate deaminase
MERERITSDAAPGPAARYSQGIAAAGFVFTAGQGAHDPVTGELPDGIEAQTRATLANVEAILRAGGSSLADAVKAQVFLADRADYHGLNAVWDELMPEPPPVRTTVVAGLGAGMLVEIDVVAVRPSP